MDIKQIRAAVTVASTGSFSAAAAKLSYSVSAISKQISSLESELGVPLFDRRANAKVSQTPECAEILSFLQNILDSHDSMRKMICTHFRTDECVLTVGTVASLSTTGLENHLAGFLKKNPGVMLNWFFDTEENLLSEVMDRPVDIGLTGMIESTLLPEIAGQKLEPLLEAAHVDERDLAFVPFYHGELMMALAADHPAIRDGTVRLEDLKNERFLFTDAISESGFRKHDDFRKACKLAGFEPDMTEMNVENRDLMMSMVAHADHRACDGNRSGGRRSGGYCHKRQHHTPRHRRPYSPKSHDPGGRRKPGRLSGRLLDHDARHGGRAFYPSGCGCGDADPAAQSYPVTHRQPQQPVCFFADRLSSSGA